jgi:hypothetical protein
MVLVKVLKRVLGGVRHAIPIATSILRRRMSRPGGGLSDSGGGGSGGGGSGGGRGGGEGNGKGKPQQIQANTPRESGARQARYWYKDSTHASKHAGTYTHVRSYMHNGHAQRM